MKLIPELNTKSLFTLYTAKVAGGKTYNVKELFKNNDIKLLFVSPLRALLNEVYLDLSGQFKNVYILGGKMKKDDPLEKIICNFRNKRKAALFVTFELLSDEILEELKNEKVLVVIDEFHLVYQWGKGFRPILHERFLSILLYDFAAIGLSATMDANIMLELNNDLKFHENIYIYLDDGNMKLKYSPDLIRNYHYVSKNIFIKKFWRDLKFKNKNEVFLIFVEYRSLVDDFVQFGKKNGHNILGCVGGEVDQFQKELQFSWDQVDCIVSTSALSHGINLPEIRRVYISYEVKDYNFWLQMIGRGGRKGSEYEVHHFDLFDSSKTKLFIDSFSTYLCDLLS